MKTTMKKIIILIFIFLISFSICTFAAVSTKESLNAIENNIFGYEYKNESETKRIERLEEHLYGEKRTGNIQKRLETIQTDTGIIVQDPQKIQQQANNPQPNIPNVKEDASVDYPIVDKMEEEIFHTTYKKENIYNRLNRLEEKVFTKTSNADLNTRVDKLASVLKPQMLQNQHYQNNYSVQEMDDYYNQAGFDTVNSQTLPFQMMALEEDLFKKTYMDDNNANRLSRLEQRLFNKTFPTDPDTTRMQRLKVAYDAKQNSYKYENNRRMQNMATMSQLGGILLMILAILL